MSKRESWSNQLLYISTVAGATIGFGATWRFPYQVGQNGGGAYLLVFILAMIVLGVPMLMAEHIIGRRLHTNTIDAFGRGNLPNPISKWWKGIGIFAILGAFGILAYYMVLGGWVFGYIADIAMGSIDLSQKIDNREIATFFKDSISDSWKISLYTLLFVGINYYILTKGIIQGIEKLISRIMPIFLILLVVMVIYSLQLPGASAGVKFYLVPDFSKISPNIFLQALGQVFFALSLGFGVMITLSSYLNKKENMARISIITGVINTMIPLMLGFVIFPALFSGGLEPSAGPTLVFQALPVVFSSMPFGTVVGLAFFTLLLLAALTTSLTIYEVIITTLVEKTPVSRRFATFITLAVIFLLGNLPSILSDGPWHDVRIFGMTIFDAFDSISANVFFVLTSFLSCIFIGFVLKRAAMIEEITNDGTVNNKLAVPLFYYIKYFIPLLIAVIAIMNFV
ncbi:sodium-dependent transporter [Wohlfahrtiimonas chitiniclastica]|uniref:Transporter n=1 Tax=Wohlfahrtiimonas chitiniclastica TaxID=400946 RepID=A0AB35BVA8_9GAMM|nr:sodium-dependent transporter [Wohlfahrtiimonas chitiniclastica]MBS7814616.1 sodium-dependent transporter [Wohlfahrtiimonas chitiniclastica]MBS7824159.1 sodium-dependent transporter [Wohlfahrtiimonas chitiniclastica]MBS7838471.1 sodium-dependent transporter [Wohlfahrtiimonas chitiniclastica]MBS7840267.1 sodium-dependent transporter [Wohlfahrtiimonas chitiniclastica]OYQ71158.1 sodium-dependent transporter [Wohlfahrtiimonas chitiniclastica]